MRRRSAVRLDVRSIVTILTAGAIKPAAMRNLGCVNAETVCKCRNFENKST